VQAEEAIQVERGLCVGSRRPGDGKPLAKGVKVRVSVWDDDVKAVGSAPLKDADQDFLSLPGGCVAEGGGP
jgi:hypothetical protein